MIYTYSDYETRYGVTLTSSQRVNLAEYVESLEESIEEYIGCSLKVIEDYEETYDLDNCHFNIVKIQAWQDNSKFKVYLLAKDKTVIKELMPNIDFKIDKSTDKKCILALDFNCYSSCFNCNQLLIKGDFGWSNPVPKRIKELLHSTVKELMIIGNVPTTSQSNNRVLTSERSLDMARTWQATTNLLGDFTVTRNVLSILGVTETLNKFRDQVKSNVYALDDCNNKCGCC
jgi:hypothetical protein